MCCSGADVSHMLLRSEPSPTHISGSFGIICGDSTSPLPLGWFWECAGRCLRSCNRAHFQNVSLRPSENRGCSLGAPSLGNYREITDNFVMGP